MEEIRFPKGSQIYWLKEIVRSHPARPSRATA